MDTKDKKFHNLIIFVFSVITLFNLIFSGVSLASVCPKQISGTFIWGDFSGYGIIGHQGVQNWAVDPKTAPTFNFVKNKANPDLPFNINSMVTLNVTVVGMNPCIVSIETSATMPDTTMTAVDYPFIIEAFLWIYSQPDWKLIPISYDCSAQTTPSGSTVDYLPYYPVSVKPLCSFGAASYTPAYSDSAAWDAFITGGYASGFSYLGPHGNYSSLTAAIKAWGSPGAPHGPYGAVSKTKVVFELQTPQPLCNGLILSLTDPYVWPIISELPLEMPIVMGPVSTTVTAKVSAPAPPGGCEVVFSDPTPLAKSGGHIHDDTSRPHGLITINGSLSQKSCTIYEGQNACTDEIIYTSSDVSGVDSIKATLKDTGETNEAVVVVKVPDLVSMPGSASYRLTGQTLPHPDNHYLTGSSQVGLIKVTDAYLNKAKFTLGLNDMSLPLGGTFDINQNWLPPHHWHRVGTSADIDHAIISQSNPPVTARIDCLVNGRNVGNKAYQKLKQSVGDLGMLLCESTGMLHIEFPP